MTIREIYALAKLFNAELRKAPRIGKGATTEECRCGLKDWWALPETFPWYVSGLCPAHDRLWLEGKLSQREMQQWWVVNAWKHSPTWEMKLFYALTLPTMISVTLARYRQKDA